MKEFVLGLVEKEGFIHFVKGNFGFVNLFSPKRLSVLILKLNVHFHAESLSDGNESVSFMFFVFLFLEGSGFDHFGEEMNIIVKAKLLNFRQVFKLHSMMRFFVAFFGFRCGSSLLKRRG